MIRVYVSAAYSDPDPAQVEENVRWAIAAGERLDQAGLNACVPHLFHFWDRMYPGSYERWMAKCLDEVPRCDVMLRRPRTSIGADREVRLAEEAGVPVFYSVEEVLSWLE